jgi:hypothetical protein
MSNNNGEGSFVDHPTVRQVGNEEREFEAAPPEVNPTEDFIVKKILHTLSIYPGISMTMLQVGVGPSIPPAIWKPILNDLKGKGRVEETSETVESPTGRMILCKHLRLKPQE